MTSPSYPLSPGTRLWLWARLAIRAAILVGLLLVVFLAGPPLLPLCMPFLLALFFTWLTEPLLRFFHTRWKLPRGVGAILLILLLTGALGGLLTALVWRGWTELSNLLSNWEDLWYTFQNGYFQLTHTMDKWLTYLPEKTQETIWGLSDRLLAWLEGLVYNLAPRTTSAVRSISSFVVAFFFVLIAWFFTAADYPHLRRLAHERLPASVRRIAHQGKSAFGAAFGGYVKAEVLVSLGVMAILLVGFLLMGQPYWVLLAVVLGILDFIPIIGSGTVMVPWAIALLVLGRWEKAMAMLVVWGVVCLFRRMVEPKIVGDQTGLHPLLSLFAIYVGMKIGGVLAMILAPVLLLMLRNLWRAGMFHATVADLAMVCRDLEAILRRAPAGASEKGVQKSEEES